MQGSDKNGTKKEAVIKEEQPVEDTRLLLSSVSGPPDCCSDTRRYGGVNAHFIRVESLRIMSG